MKRIALSMVATALMTLLAIIEPPSCAAHTLRVTDGSYVPFTELIEELAEVSLVFIGELHGHVGHHQAQLQVIKALHQRGQPVAIGVEMFRKENQDILDQWVMGEINEADFLKIYNESWGMWDKYRSIFLYARDNRIPMVALNISREITQQIAQEGFASLAPQQLEELPPIRCEVDPAYERFIRQAFGKHVHNGSDFKNFCEAQLVWDNIMAESLLEFLGSYPDYTVVVLAGSGHAWKHGVPEQVQVRQEVQYRVLLPAIPGRIEPGKVTNKETDYLLIGLEEGLLH